MVTGKSDALYAVLVAGRYETLERMNRGYFVVALGVYMCLSWLPKAAREIFVGKQRVQLHSKIDWALLSTVVRVYQTKFCRLRPLYPTHLFKYHMHPNKRKIAIRERLRDLMEQRIWMIGSSTDPRIETNHLQSSFKARNSDPTRDNRVYLPCLDFPCCNCNSCVQ